MVFLALGLMEVISSTFFALGSIFTSQKAMSKRCRASMTFQVPS